MQRTEHLNLPIYNTPDVDIFDLQDWNEANEVLDGAYKDIVNFREELPKVNANAEIVEARKGKLKLADKITEMDNFIELNSSQLEQIATETIPLVNSNIDNNTTFINNINKKINKSGASCIARFTTDKIIAFNNSTWQQLIFDEFWTNDSEIFQLNNGIIKTFKKGVYLIETNIAFTGQNTTSYRQVLINRTSVQDLVTGSTNEKLTDWSYINLSYTQVLDINDTIQLKGIIKDTNATLPKRNQTNYLKMTLLMDLSVIDNTPTLYHVLGTGQSLSVGAEGNPTLSKETPLNLIGKCFMFNGGSRPLDSADQSSVEEINLPLTCINSFKNLKEQDKILNFEGRTSTIGETISSSLGYNFSKLTGQRILVSQHGFGGKGYNQLKKGTIAYNNSILAVQEAKKIAENNGWKYVVLGVTVMHGEYDSVMGTTYSNYIQYLKDWQNDYDADIKVITGQTETVKLFIGQTSCASGYNLTASPIANAMLRASIDDTDVVLVSPQYMCTYAQNNSSPHMDNYGYRKKGEYFGKAIADIYNKGVYSPLRPIKSTLSGTKVTISFNVSNSPLILDINNVKQVSDNNYGFKLINDTNGNTITNVIINGTTVEITLSGTPSQYAQISYAYEPLTDQKGKMGKDYGVRGCLRDSSGFKSYFTGESLPNWCVAFAISLNWVG